ncbi:MAG TPA: hypothetical protein DCW90_15645 [Lachnospiraceae bacterium]|nr:hypothetical protein [Lachnospiraceae bacterium]
MAKAYYPVDGTFKEWTPDMVGAAAVSHTHNYAGSDSAGGTANGVKNVGSGTADAARHVWFSDSATETSRVSNDNFKYNPVGNKITSNITGNAATASTVVDYANAGQTIQIGYAGSGLTSSQVAYGLGYTSDRKIKDVSKDEYRKWLGLGSLAYISSLGEANLTWGGKNFSGSFGPLDAAMVPALGANRLAFMPPSAIEVQYSTDNGTTWAAYPSISDATKTNLFNGNNTALYIGANSATKIDKTKYQLRITITTDAANVYTVLNKFVIYISTNGSTGSWCSIDAKTKANVDSGTDTWVNFADKVDIIGWSGYNVINTNGIITYGNTNSQYQKLRFTFGVTSHAATVTSQGLSVLGILGFGGVGWNTPSILAKTGHIYSYDNNQNTTFPAGVTASWFSGNASSATKLQTKRKITISGAVTGNIDFDGSENVTISTSKNHTHTKSEITDFPTSMPASDVYSWAKAATKPTYTKSEIGLSNVNNTSDADKSVKYAASADTANTATAIKTSGKITSSDAITGENTGLKLYEIYGQSAPFSYGHIIQTGAGNAKGQLALQWNGNGIAYRSVGDMGTKADWAKVYTTSNKPSKSDVGLGNVDNTADSAKSVKYATSAGTASTANAVAWGNVTGKPSSFSPSKHTHVADEITSVNASAITGTIAAANLPSYVDDVLEYDSLSKFPSTGETGKIYTAKDTNKIYRWSGSAYVVISDTLALGTTSSTAFRGDYGDTAYQHATAKGSAFSSGLYKITTNTQGHVTGATAVVKADITALGIPATNTTYSTGTASSSGITKLYTGKGSATDGTMTQNAITSALNNIVVVSSTEPSVSDCKIWIKA